MNNAIGEVLERVRIVGFSVPHALYIFSYAYRINFVLCVYKLWGYSIDIVECVRTRSMLNFPIDSPSDNVNSIRCCCSKLNMSCT